MPTIISLLGIAALWLAWDNVPSAVWWTGLVLLILHWWCAATVRTAHRNATSDRLERGWEPGMSSGFAKYDPVVTFWVKASLGVTLTSALVSISLIIWRFAAA